MEPPFVPDIEDKLSTEYFQDRYHFTNDNENDIIEDIKEAKKQSSSSYIKRPKSIRLSDLSSRPKISKTTTHFSIESTMTRNFLEDLYNEEEVTPDMEISRAFPAVSVQQLINKNQQIVRNIRHRRTLSNVFAVSDNDFLSQVKKKVQNSPNDPFQ